MTIEQVEEAIADNMIKCNRVHRQLMYLRRKHGPDSKQAQAHEKLIKILNRHIVLQGNNL